MTSVSETAPEPYLAWVADRLELGEDVKYTARHHGRLRLGQVTAV